MQEHSAIDDYLAAVRDRLAGLVRLIAVPALADASGHLLGLGKLFRPRLVRAAYLAFAPADDRRCLAAAAAVETLHTSTLIHDDLPSLDDAELRRGRPAVHTAHGEATAILAGDALMNLAFVSLTEEAAYQDETAIRLTQILAWAAGEIMAGQVLDILGESRQFEIRELEALHKKKTGALLGACCEMGAVLAGGTDEQAAALRSIGINIGLGFQVRDDLLSIQGSESVTGKSLAVDREKGKTTYPRLLGVAQSEQLTANLLAAIKQQITDLELSEPAPLREMAHLAVDRDH